MLKLKSSISNAIKNESAFLYAQIKPHFIYNVLNTIAGLCSDNPQKAETLILNLSDYLRGRFSFINVEDFVSLEKELYFVNNYIEIEKIRFKDRIQSKINIDRDLSLHVPSLTIQPLVENAIKHGLLKRQEGGTVTINIKRMKNGNLIEVIDDGVGTKITSIEELSKNSTSGSGIGLINIDKRLKQLYSTGLNFESTPNVGTKVSFYIRNN